MRKLQIWQNETHPPQGISQLRSTAPLVLEAGLELLVSHRPHLACFTHLNYLLNPVRPDLSKPSILFRKKDTEAVKWNWIWVFWLQI